MNCERARELLPLLEADGARYGERSSRRVAEHLATCAGCRAYQAELERLRGVLRPAGRISFEPDYLDDFQARVSREILREEQQTAGWAAVWWRRLEANPLPALAQAAAVIWVAGFLALQLPGVEPMVGQLLGL